MRWTEGWLVLLLAGACASTPGVRLPSPATLERASLMTQARAVARTWMQDNPPEQLAWSWGEGVLAYGLWQLQRANGGDSLREYLQRYVRTHQAAGARVVWSDDTTPGLSAAELVLAGDTSVRPILDRVTYYAMSAPRTEAQGLVRHLGEHVATWIAPRVWFPDAWVDSLFHITITLCRYSRVTQDARYRDEAVHQLQLFMRNLQDPATGLVTHAYNDFPRNQQVPSFAQRAFWARGNAWALVSLVEVWRELPANHPARDELAGCARRLADSLMHVQTERGLFHTLLLDPSTYEETAGSALIVYGLALGVRSGLFAESDAAARGMRGLVGVLEQRGERLEVSGTSLGTNPNARRYASIGRRNQVSYGVGAWLLAASMFLD